MRKRLLSLVLTGGILLGMMTPTYAFGNNTIRPFYKDGDRIVEYFSFDWKVQGTSGHNPWDGSSKTIVKKYDREWVVTVEKFRNLNYSVGYAMGVPNSGSLYTDFTYKYGTGNYGGDFYGNYVGNRMCLVGEIDSREPSHTSPRVGGQFSPDAPW